MAEKSTIARPYAQAVFDLAVSGDRLDAWSETLDLAAFVAADEGMRRLIGNPRIDKERIASLFIDICGERLDSQACNLIKVLIDNGRLELLPEIHEQFEIYKGEAQKTIQAQVIAAYPLSEEQQATITAALKQRLGCEVTLDCQVDDSLLGGAIIRAGDLVIDGTVTGQLDKLRHVLSQ